MTAQDVRALRDIPAEKLDELFGEATRDAVARDLAAGIPVTGMVGDRIVTLHPHAPLVRHEPLEFPDAPWITNR